MPLRVLPGATRVVHLIARSSSSGNPYHVMTTGSVQIGVAALPFEAGAPSADQHLVVPVPHGALVAVVGGLDRSKQACQAASVAVETLKQRPDDSLSVLLLRCHEALQGTCGVALGLAMLDARSEIMSWLGVGNVWGSCFSRKDRLLACREFLLPRRGVVGLRLTLFQPTHVSLQPDDTLVFATRGVRADAVRNLPASRGAQQIADDLLVRHGTDADGALVLVARYAGCKSSPEQEPRAP